MTRTYLFLHKFWFFSTIYYFGNWAFVAVSPRLHTSLRVAGKCTSHIFYSVFSTISSQEQICKGFSLIQNQKGGNYYIHTRHSQTQANVSSLMSVFVCRPSSSVWQFPAAEGRSLWLKGRWKLMILTSAMMNTCTELQQQQCSLGWLGRYFQIYYLIYQFNSPDLFLLSRVCSGVLPDLDPAHPSPYWVHLGRLSFPVNAIDVFEIPAPTSEIHSPQVWSRPFFCWRSCFCKLLLNFKLKQVT